MSVRTIVASEPTRPPAQLAEIEQLEHGTTLRRSSGVPTVCGDDTSGELGDLVELGNGTAWHIVALTGPDRGFLSGAAFVDLGHEVSSFASVQTLLDAGAIARADVLLVGDSLDSEEVRRFVAHTREMRPTLPILYYADARAAGARVVPTRADLPNADPLARSGAQVKRAEAKAAGADDWIDPAASASGSLSRVAMLIHERAMQTTPLSLAEGSVVPGTNYRVERQLGEGGMGAVYLATHLTIERKSALKVLSPRHVRDPRSVRTFRNEARASARIGSAHIIDVYDFIELDDGRLILCMEYLDGVALDAKMQTQTFGLREVISTTRQICRGLAAAHAAGIVHRDVKPDNVMIVRRQGRPNFVKLLDFGISAIATERRGALPIAGTPGYMAPETIAGGDPSPSADMYAVGCMLFEWATGRLPFEGTTQRVLLAHAHETPPPVASVAKRDLPAKLVTLIDRCLAKDPKDRYADMAELDAALIEVQLADAISTDWDDLPPLVGGARGKQLRRGLRRLRTARERSRRTWISVGAAAALLVVGTGAGQWFGAQPQAVDETARIAVAAHAPAALAAAERYDYLHGDLEGTSSALEHLLALENSDDEGNLALAKRLRARFSQELLATAEELWANEETRAQSRQVYAQARVFDPNNGQAIVRSGLSGTEFKDYLLAARSGLGPSPTQATDEAKSPAKKHHQPAGVNGKQARHAPAPAPAEGPIVAVSTPQKRAKPSGLGNGGQASVKRMMARADKALEKRDYDGARRYYAKVLDRRPGHLAALDGLAQLHYAKGSYRDAARYARMAAKRGRGHARRWLMLGDAEFKLLHYSKARDAYERADKLGSSAADGRLRKVEDTLGG